MAEHAFYRGDELEAVIAHMARRAQALVADPATLVVVGILRRGAPLADRLCVHLARLCGVVRIERMDLDIKRYADDLSLLYPQTRLRETGDVPVANVSGRSVLLVDDVLYEGHSMLRAVHWLVQHGAGVVRTAVLVDRACARLPLAADIAGITLEVAPRQIVDVHVPPYESDFGIYINRRGDDDVQEP